MTVIRDLSGEERRGENHILQPFMMKAVHSVRTFRINIFPAQHNNSGNLDPQCIQSTENRNRTIYSYIGHNCLQAALYVFPIDIKVLAVEMYTYFNTYTVQVT